MRLVARRMRRANLVAGHASACGAYFRNSGRVSNGRSTGDDG
jgi:hypothetical protein